MQTVFKRALTLEAKQKTENKIEVLLFLAKKNVTLTVFKLR